MKNEIILNRHFIEVSFSYGSKTVKDYTAISTTSPIDPSLETLLPDHERGDNRHHGEYGLVQSGRLPQGVPKEFFEY